MATPRTFTFQFPTQMISVATIDAALALAKRFHIKPADLSVDVGEAELTGRVFRTLLVRFPKGVSEARLVSMGMWIEGFCAGRGFTVA